MLNFLFFTVSKADVGSSLVNFCVQSEKEIHAGFQPAEFDRYLPAGRSFWSTIKKNIQNKDYFLVWENSKTYWVLASDVKKTSKSECLKLNQCATIINSNNENDFQGIKLPPQSRFPIINMRTKSNSVISYLLKLSDGETWIDSSQVFVSDQPCSKSNENNNNPTTNIDNLNSKKSAAPILNENNQGQTLNKNNKKEIDSFIENKKTNWNYAFLVGGSILQSNKSFEVLLTNVPNPADTSRLQNPIISEISQGAGFTLGPRLSFDVLNNKYKSAFGLYYQQLVYNYVGRLNPSVTSVSYDSLQIFEDNFEVKNLIADIAFMGKYKINRKSFFNYGLGIDLMYRISEQNKVTIRTGSVFKGTESTITGGPEQTHFRLLPRLEYELGSFLLISRVSLDAEIDIMAGIQF